MDARLTTLCYIEKDGKYLMLHRVKKEVDENKDKWIGVGGKFEPGETPEECLRLCSAPGGRFGTARSATIFPWMRSVRSAPTTRATHR